MGVKYRGLFFLISLGAVSAAGWSCQTTPESMDGGLQPPDAGDAGQLSDAGSPDAGDAGALRDAGTPDAGPCCSYWDGGTCSNKLNCPCFSSDDCPPTHRCESEDSTGLHVYCKPGVRGPGLVGATCQGELDCRSALCTELSSTVKYCSALCGTKSDCPAVLPKCIYIAFDVNRSICSP